MSQTSLETLLERWSEAHDRGEDLAPADLCLETPALLAELTRQIADVRRMKHLVEQMSASTLVPATICSMGQTVASVRPAGEVPLPEIPGYEILAELGRGGMAIVYLAHDHHRQHLVAIKTAREPGAFMQSRFRQEAEIVQQLTNRGIVRIHEIGQCAVPGESCRPFLTMELCVGGSLADKLGGKRMPPWSAARLVGSLARTMTTVHRAGIVHRDLKPANVLLGCRASNVDERGPRLRFEPKITDFDIAKRIGLADHSWGQILGTPSYMAPEQAEGRTTDIGPAADIYALGAILYECLTGRPPFLGICIYETLQMVQEQSPVAPRELNPRCPRELERITLKCLHKEPAERYPTAKALALALMNCCPFGVN